MVGRTSDIWTNSICGPVRIKLRDKFFIFSLSARRPIGQYSQQISLKRKNSESMFSDWKNFVDFIHWIVLPVLETLQITDIYGMLLKSHRDQNIRSFFLLFGHYILPEIHGTNNNDSSINYNDNNLTKLIYIQMQISSN